MKKVAGLCFLQLFILQICVAQKPVNWTEKQLMEPATLAADLNSKKNIPFILCIGPGASIPNSVDIGMVNTKEGLDKFRNAVSKIAKDKRVVIYCGCCPFERCPNVRPAIDILKELKFSNWYLLNLPNNLRKDWIDKGFPTTKS